MNAPTELHEATALLLQSTLLDETTARLLTNERLLGAKRGSIAADFFSKLLIK